MTRKNIDIPSCNNVEERTGPSALTRHAALILLLITAMAGCGKPGASGLKPGVNSPPVISAVRLVPGQAFKGIALSVLVDSHDPEGDTVSYEYRWTRNDAEISGEQGNVLPDGLFKKGDLIRVEVTPRDAHTKGTPVASSPVKILNAPPVALAAWVEPRNPGSSDALKAVCTSEDKDADFVFFNYRWEKNGVSLQDETSQTLGPDKFKKGDSIAVVITPDDRETAGKAKRSAPVVISNSPPVIESSPPVRSQGNLYEYRLMARDADNDPLAFTLKSGPKGMKVDKQSGLIQWEVQRDDKGLFPVEIEVSDPEGGKTLQRYTLNVDIK
jgi:hypothetical protein